MRGQPIAPRRRVPRAAALPVAVGVTLGVTAVVMLGGGLGDVGGASSASAITEALHWLNPPPGTILHTRSVETMRNQTTTRELWQSSEHPGSERLRTVGAKAFETSGVALYDPATDTIYDPLTSPAAGGVADAKRAQAKVATPVTGTPGGDAVPGGDPVVAKVRTLLREGRMVVTGPEIHDGTDAWAISLKRDFGEPVWTLWVSAADGKPLELRDPGRDASQPPQVIHWPIYEVLPGANADKLLTLTGAHPSARVVHDPSQIAAAERRLMP